MGQIDMTLSSTVVTLVDGKASVTATVRNAAATAERVVVRAFGGSSVSTAGAAADGAAPVPAPGRERSGPAHATASPVPPDPTAWVSVADSLREIAPEATEQFLLTVEVAGAGPVPGGTYAVKVNAYSADEPPEANSGPVLDLQITVPPTEVVEPKRGWFRWWMAAAAVGLLVAVAVVAFLFWPRGVEVPDVLGTPADEALVVLAEADLGAHLLPVESDDPAGTVIGQAPAAGDDVERKTTINLEVAAVRTVPMPDVVGQTAAAATTSLQDIGLTPVFETGEGLCGAGSTCKVSVQFTPPHTIVPVGEQVRLVATVTDSGSPTSRPTFTFSTRFPTAFECPGSGCFVETPWERDLRPDQLRDLSEQLRLEADGVFRR